MKFAKLTSRLAVGGVATALATAGLVGVTSTSASAATATTNYTCSVPSVFSDTFPVSVTVPVIPATAPAGFPVPAGLLSFTSTLTAPATIAPTLTALGINGGKSTDFATAFGTKAAPAPVTWGTKTENMDGSVTFSGTGANAAFTLPAAGTYAVTMPKQFTLIPTQNGAAFPATATCTSAAPATIASITLSKQASMTKVKGPKSAKVGAVVTLKVTVTDDYSKTGGVIPSGKLIVKDGKKKVGNGKLDSKGKAKIKVKGLKKGSHKLTVYYKGDSYNEKSKSKALKLTVKA